MDDREIEVTPELTIGIYQELQRNPKKYEDKAEMLALFLGFSKEELRALPVDQVQVVEEFINLKLTEFKKEEITFTFKIDGITYGLENQWNKMTWGCWVDLEVFSQADKIQDNIHYLMAILYRPVILNNKGGYTIEEYNGDKLEERAKLFQEKCPIVYWFGAAQFFFSIVREYIIILETSLRRKMKWMKRIMKIQRILPPFLRRKLRLDSILTLPSDSVMRILQNSNN